MDSGFIRKMGKYVLPSIHMQKRLTKVVLSITQASSTHKRRNYTLWARNPQMDVFTASQFKVISYQNSLTLVILIVVKQLYISQFLIFPSFFNVINSAVYKMLIFLLGYCSDLTYFITHTLNFFLYSYSFVLLSHWVKGRLLILLSFCSCECMSMVGYSVSSCGSEPVSALEMVCDRMEVMPSPFRAYACLAIAITHKVSL